MTDKRKLKPDELLMASIGFDEDDLAANRAGKLGPNQAARLKRLQQSARISGVAASAVGLFFVLSGLALTIIGFLGAIGLVIVGLMFLAVGMQLFMRNGLWTLRAARAQLLDSQMNAVERIEGRLYGVVV
jgi:Flp pilus assembly protein TadB